MNIRLIIGSVNMSDAADLLEIYSPMESYSISAKITKLSANVCIPFWASNSRGLFAGKYPVKRKQPHFCRCFLPLYFTARVRSFLSVGLLAAF